MISYYNIIQPRRFFVILPDWVWGWHELRTHTHVYFHAYVHACGLTYTLTCIHAPTHTSSLTNNTYSHMCVLTLFLKLLTCVLIYSLTHTFVHTRQSNNSQICVPTHVSAQQTNPASCVVGSALPGRAASALGWVAMFR